MAPESSADSPTKRQPIDEEDSGQVRPAIAAEEDSSTRRTRLAEEDSDDEADAPVRYTTYNGETQRVRTFRKKLPFASVRWAALRQQILERASSLRSSRRLRTPELRRTAGGVRIGTISGVGASDYSTKLCCGYNLIGSREEVEHWERIVLRRLNLRFIRARNTTSNPRVRVALDHV